MTRELKQHEVNVEGVGNLLSCREIDQGDIISFMDHRNDIRNLLDTSFSGIHVLFSDEDDSFVIGNSSIISSGFSKNGQVAGHLGLIGPMRINYKKVIPYVEYFAEKITELLSSEDENGEGKESEDK